MGGRTIAGYTVMGEYDYVAVVEAPSDEEIVTMCFRLAEAGLVRTTTMRALSLDEMLEALEKLPEVQA